MMKAPENSVLLSNTRLSHLWHRRRGARSPEDAPLEFRDIRGAADQFHPNQPIRLLIKGLFNPDRAGTH